jgi:uncharacterized protein with HEPN domain
MKHPERVQDYLEHVSEAIERATGYLRSVPDLEAFKKNQQVQDAIIRNIEIIGEAANKINSVAPDFIKQHPELPWAQMHGMRNKVNGYFDVELTVVWGTVKDDLPQLKKQIDAFAKAVSTYGQSSKAFLAIRRREVVLHREWMIRLLARGRGLDKSHQATTFYISRQKITLLQTQ